MCAHTRRNVPTSRIALRLAVATGPTAPNLRALAPSAAAKLAAQAIGAALLMALLAIDAFVATVALAARGPAATLAEFVRLATAVIGDGPDGHRDLGRGGSADPPLTGARTAGVKSSASVIVRERSPGIARLALANSTGDR
jgi:hypothetical protein